MSKKFGKLLIAGAAFATLAMAVPAHAVTFTGSAISNEDNTTLLSASAEFTINLDGNLVVVLTNTSTVDVMVQANLLSGVYWDCASCASLTTTGGSATLTDTTSATPDTVFNAPTQNTSGGSTYTVDGDGPDVGGEFGYEYDATGLVGDSSVNAPGDTTNGISSTGLGIFGSASRWETGQADNLQGPESPDGSQYGITSAGDDPTTMQGTQLTDALIQNSVTFILAASEDFNLSQLNNVWFQYGTSLSNPSYGGNCTSNCGPGNFPPPVPVPPGVWFLLSGILGLGFLGRIRRKSVAS